MLMEVLFFFKSFGYVSMGRLNDCQPAWIVGCYTLTVGSVCVYERERERERDRERERETQSIIITE